MTGSGFSSWADLDDAARGWSFGQVLDGLAAFGLTYGIAHYGLVAVYGALPWLLLRDRSRPWPWGWFAVAALSLALTITLGGAELGEADHALWAASGQALIWVHATGWARWFWGGLTLLGLAWVGAGLVTTLLAGGPDPAAAASAWWDRWHWPVLGGLGCGVLWVLTFGAEDEGRAHGGVAGFGGPVTGPDTVAQRLRVEAGLAGEQRVQGVLLEQLPEGMCVLNNLQLPTLAGDIDLVVVGPNGVFLPEVKTWSGAISCAPDGRTWSRVRSGRWELLPNPAAQTQGEIRALRRYLEAADPDLCRRTQLWIEGLIVFAHPSASVDARYSQVPALSPEDAAEAIRTAVPRRPLTLADQERIVQLLSAVQPAMRL